MAHSGLRAAVNKYSAVLREMPSKQIPYCGTVKADMFKTSHLSLYRFLNALFSWCFHFIISIIMQIGMIFSPDMMKWYHLLAQML